jgi:hypothetical protein
VQTVQSSELTAAEAMRVCSLQASVGHEYQLLRLTLMAAARKSSRHGHGDRPPLRFSTIFCPRSKITSELSGVLSSDLAIGIDAGLSGQIDGPVWSVFDRGTAGPLDRVAQLAERKYCRPQARKTPALLL